MTPHVNAVVLCGGDGTLLDPATRFKGLVPVLGRPMAEWVVETLLASESVDRVAVVIPDDADVSPWLRQHASVVVRDGRFIDNVFAGIDSFGDGRASLVTTGDIPALTTAAVDDFVARASAAGADFAYPLVPEDDMLAQFPGSKRTFVRIVGGRVTGGNVSLLSPELVARNRDIGQRLFDTRKSPVAMARVVGLPFVVKLALGRLRPVDVERRMERLLGGRCAAITTSHASIGADVDKPVDLGVVEGVLSARTRG